MFNWWSTFKSFLVSLLLEALKRFGPIPGHVSIIMDGNRRFAKKRGLERASAGHFEGAKTLEKLLNYGFRLGVKTVTVYAFSIENFKRPAEEVDVLMSLAAEKLHQLSQKSDLVKKFKVRINVLGALHLLPKHVQKAAAEAMQDTLEHDQFILNICFPYTASDEIDRALKLSKAYHESTNTITVLSDFNAFLDTWDSPPLDILIRTSGEHRLSEFLLWQVCSFKVQVEILECLWPEFGFKELLEIVLRYQRLNKTVKKSKDDDSDDYLRIKAWRLNQKRELLTTMLQ